MTATTGAHPRALKAVLAALLLVAAASAADAIFVEEAGKLDWIVQRVGAVRDAVFLPSYVDFRNTTVRGVVVCTEQNFVAVLNLRSGAIVWRKKLDDPVDRLALAGSQVITLSKGASSVKSWDFRTGALTWDAKVDGGVDLAVSEGGKTVGVVTSANELVVYGSVSGEKEETLKGKTHKGWVLAGSTAPGSLAADLKLGPSAVLSRPYTLEGTEYAAAVEMFGTESTVTVINVKTKSVESTETYKIGSSDHVAASKVYLSGYKSKQGSPGFRILLVGQDASLSLLQQSEVVWLREEAMASVEHSLMVDFPVDSTTTQQETAAAEAEEKSMTIADELKFQLLKAKSALQIASPEEAAEMKAMAVAKKRTETASFDPNGFKKQILALTAAGKLFALHSSDGRILWTKNLSGKDQAFVGMWVYRQGQTSTESPEIAILTRTEGSSQTTLCVVDGWTGAVLTKKAIAASPEASLVMMQPAGPSSLQGALLIDFSRSVAHVVLSDESDRDVVDLRSVFVYRVDESENAVSGYKVSSGKGAALPLTNLWTMRMPEGQRIVGSASPDFFQKVYSRTRVLGDRSALYKYINPNTLFVAAETAASEGNHPKVVVYLVDTVTGKLLYTVAHKHAMGPVSVVFHEHWIVYKYWNVRGNRDEMSVLELYEDEPLKNSNSISSHLWDLVTKPSNGSASVSSYAPSAIRVLGQTYVLSLPVTTMTVTISGLGITANQVLVGTVSDQIYAIDKKLLNPRRPVKPTAADKEEGLIPYNEFLPIAPQRYITYTNQVQGLRSIQCYPTRRESSVLVLAHGVDTFYARLMPSKSYDMLEDDFSYSLLVTTILGLLVATFVVRAMVKKDNLKRNWV